MCCNAAFVEAVNSGALAHTAAVPAAALNAFPPPGNTCRFQAVIAEVQTAASQGSMAMGCEALLSNIFVPLLGANLICFSRVPSLIDQPSLN